jgi:hypothetical protein
VNVQSRWQLVEIDPTTDRVITRIDLPGARGNHGLLIEPQQRLAFIACEGNDKATNATGFQPVRSSLRKPCRLRLAGNSRR